MASRSGRSTQVFFGGRDLSGFLNSGELDVDVATMDTTTFGNSWKTSIADILDASFSTSGFYDPDLTDLQAALDVDGGVLTWCPGGGAIGDRARMLLVTGTSYGQSSQVGEVVAFAWDAVSEAALAIGDVLHALTEDTNTTTGPTKDESASSSTGWTAHLHVTAVDAGAWVIKLEDSANGSSWSDVTAGAFASKSAAGAERLRSASGTTTLRRYVRCTATRTGGSSGDGITYALAIARSRQ